MVASTGNTGSGNGSCLFPIAHFRDAACRGDSSDLLALETPAEVGKRVSCFTKYDRLFRLYL